MRAVVDEAGHLVQVGVAFVRGQEDELVFGAQRHRLHGHPFLQIVVEKLEQRIVETLQQNLDILFIKKNLQICLF